MNSTLFGMVAEVMQAQKQKALSPMLITLLGIVTVSIVVQLQKVNASMLVTLFGIVIDFSWPHP